VIVLRSVAAGGSASDKPGAFVGRFGFGPEYPPTHVRHAMIIHAERSGVAVPLALGSLFSAGLIAYKNDQLTVDPDIRALLETYVEQATESYC
jgi:hypothetical protein